MFTLNVADKLLPLPGVNSVILIASTEYFGILGSKTKYITAANIPMIMIWIMMRASVQHKHFLQQLLLLFGGFVGTYGIVRVGGAG